VNSSGSTRECRTRLRGPPYLCYAGRVAWWTSYKERRENRETRLVEVLMTAMGSAFGHVLDAQSKQIEQNARFLDSLQDLSARKAAQIMGSRGGKRTQERKKARRSEVQACPMCENPARKDVTLEMLDFHRRHAPAAPIEYQEANGAA